jgi:hypothetical protein
VSCLAVAGETGAWLARKMERERVDRRQTLSPARWVTRGTGNDPKTGTPRLRFWIAQVGSTRSMHGGADEGRRCGGKKSARKGRATSTRKRSATCIPTEDAQGLVRTRTTGNVRGVKDSRAEERQTFLGCIEDRR